MFKHLLVPTDGSKLGAAAVMEAVALAKTFRADVTILTVTRPFHTFSFNPDMLSETPEEHRIHNSAHQREDIRLARQAAEGAGIRCEHLTVESNSLAEAVIAAAQKQRCDLVVMPAHERAGMLGSSHVDGDTTRLLARSELPVLVLHEASLRAPMAIAA